MKNILAIFLILASCGIYYLYTKNVIADTTTIGKQLAEYNETLRKADALTEEKQSISAMIDSFRAEDKEKLEKMLPDHADNVRLILDIQSIAQGAGLSIKNILVNEENKLGIPAQTGTPPAGTETNPSAFGAETSAKYNYVTLTFTVPSNYENFTIFLPNLEKSLRLVDVTGLTVKTTDASNIYNFEVTLRAYWLK